MGAARVYTPTHTQILSTRNVVKNLIQTIRLTNNQWLTSTEKTGLSTPPR